VITPADIAEWRATVPWANADQVEQDLVLSRLIVDIANDPILGPELVFRGGTCFHKLWLDQPWRYSEDLDYVRRSEGGVGEILSALRTVADHVGFDRVNTEVGRHPKARFRSTAASGRPMNVKIELNTFERSPARPTVVRAYRVESQWFTGEAAVPTFELAELIATKIRALFQRRKGRDLFDLWLAVEHGGVRPDDIAECFEPYRPDGWTVERAIENLEAKLADDRFTADLMLLIAAQPPGYSVQAAAEVAREVIQRAADE
jgi:predicted nucleotidyltransferase component of viral defense system